MPDKLDIVRAGASDALHGAHHWSAGTRATRTGCQRTGTGHDGNSDGKPHRTSDENGYVHLFHGSILDLINTVCILSLPLPQPRARQFHARRVNLTHKTVAVPLLNPCQTSFLKHCSGFD